MTIQTKIIIATVLLSTLFAFGSHVIIQGWEDQLSTEYEHLFETAKNKDKFGVEVIIVAGATGIFPVLAAYFLLYAAWSIIPGEKWWQKGLVYCLLLLALKSALIREPAMGILMEVPVWMVFAKQLDVWIPNIVLGLFLAWGVQLHHKKKRITSG